MNQNLLRNTLAGLIKCFTTPDAASLIADLGNFVVAC